MSNMTEEYLKYLQGLKKILLVEDGSIDVESLEDWAEAQNIQIIVYRQGSIKPELINVEQLKGDE